MLGFLVLMGLFTGCGMTESRCPSDPYRDYVYGDRAEVISGFYKGRSGVIVDRSRLIRNNCTVKSFVIHFDDYPIGRIVVSQYSIYVERNKKDE